MPQLADIASHLRSHGWTEKLHKDFGKESAEDMFQVQNELGYGSLGFVQEVRISGSDLGTLARKKMRLLRGDKGRAIRETIHDEVTVLKKIRHKHVVTLVGSYEDFSARGQKFYSLLMSPVGHDDLKAFLEKLSDETLQPGMTEQDIEAIPRVQWLKIWIGCLASAIAYIHSQGIRHEDIKPSNIIHYGEQVYLTDFSSAKRFEVGHTTSTESHARTSLMYAPPENVRGIYSSRKDSSSRHGLGSDIFSLGCVFIEMLTVVVGRSVEDLKVFCNNRRRRKGLRTLDTFLYSKNSQFMGEWLDKEPSDFRKIIMPMIQEERKTRPSAAAVLAKIRAHPYFNLSGPCSCLGTDRHSDQPLADNTSERVIKGQSSVSHCEEKDTVKGEESKETNQSPPAKATMRASPVQRSNSGHPSSASYDDDEWHDHQYHSLHHLPPVPSSHPPLSPQPFEDHPFPSPPRMALLPPLSAMRKYNLSPLSIATWRNPATSTLHQYNPGVARYARTGQPPTGEPEEEKYNEEEEYEYSEDDVADDENVEGAKDITADAAGPKEETATGPAAKKSPARPHAVQDEVMVVPASPVLSERSVHFPDDLREPKTNSIYKNRRPPPKRNTRPLPSGQVRKHVGPTKKERDEMRRQAEAKRREEKKKKEEEERKQYQDLMKQQPVERRKRPLFGK